MGHKNTSEFNDRVVSEFNRQFKNKALSIAAEFASAGVDTGDLITRINGCKSSGDTIWISSKLRELAEGLK